MSEQKKAAAHEHQWDDIGDGWAFVFMCECGAFWGAA